MSIRTKILGVVAGIMMLVAPVVAMAPVYADDAPEGCVESSIISNREENGKKYYCDDGQGDGVYAILYIVLNVLTIGVGVLGTLGIVVSGIQYLTAADNEQQLATAKKRIVEVVIGLAIYAIMYVALQWLIPGGLF